MWRVMTSNSELLTSEAADPSVSDAFGRGFYSSQLERIWQHYPREQVLVLISERCRRDPPRALRRVAQFLGMQEVPSMSWETFEEQHVRGWYWEEPSLAFRRQLQNFYGQEVQRLRSLLQDALPEWDDDFGGPSFIPRSLQSASVYLGDGWAVVVARSDTLAKWLTIHRSFLLGDYVLDIIGSVQ
eukprot:Skav213712  [mRNA]  locus=scaffold549:64684:69602:+ [translate_table: standard]